jgi:hypothetical protein
MAVTARTKHSACQTECAAVDVLSCRHCRQMAVTTETRVAASQTEFSLVGTSSRNVRQVAVTVETCTAACQTENAAAHDFAQHLADQTKTIAGLESARGRQIFNALILFFVVYSLKYGINSRKTRASFEGRTRTASRGEQTNRGRKTEERSTGMYS